MSANYIIVKLLVTPSYIDLKHQISSTMINKIDLNTPALLFAHRNIDYYINNKIKDKTFIKIYISLCKFSNYLQ